DGGGRSGQTQTFRRRASTTMGQGIGRGTTESQASGENDARQWLGSEHAGVPRSPSDPGQRSRVQLKARGLLSLRQESRSVEREPSRLAAAPNTQTAASSEGSLRIPRTVRETLIPGPCPELIEGPLSHPMGYLFSVWGGVS